MTARNCIIDPADIQLPESEQVCIDYEYHFLTENDVLLGQLYMAVFLVINFVIILNLVIAILSTTYEQYSQYKRGLFYDS